MLLEHEYCLLDSSSRCARCAERSALRTTLRSASRSTSWGRCTSAMRASGIGYAPTRSGKRLTRRTFARGGTAATVTEVLVAPAAPPNPIMMQPVPLGHDGIQKRKGKCLTKGGKSGLIITTAYQYLSLASNLTDIPRQLQFILATRAFIAFQR